MCTSLIYTDTSGNVYSGRTLELTVDLPYQIAWFPAGFVTTSQVEGAAALTFSARHGILAVTMPSRVPTTEQPLGFADLKVVEGMNEAGLTFSLLSFPAAGGGHHAVAKTQAVLGASDLGAWVLGQFASVAQVKAALAELPVMVQPLAMLGGLESPFHYVVHDIHGAALVIEFNHGEMSVHDNPVGVMTNGPEFTWHLTNLNNYTFLSNVDGPGARFGGYQAMQPGSGIATVGLPASNTSVGRFVRAAYYAQFAEKASTPETAISALAHIMNNFDRPRGISVDYPEAGLKHLKVVGQEGEKGVAYATEFTTWTSLSDLAGRRFFIRHYARLGYACFDIGRLAGMAQPHVLPLASIGAAAMDATSGLMEGAA